MKYINAKVLKSIWPVCFGYIPLGLACGVLAEKVGVDPIAIGVMSILVFAGSGQFIALAMIGAGCPIPPIVFTIFIVNLRHIFYATILNSYIKEKSTIFKAIFAQEIVDETSAVNMTNFEQKDVEWSAEEAITSAYLAHLSWIIATIAGCVLGSVANIDTALVSYALIAMFIGLWSFHFWHKKLILAGIAAGFLALLLAPFLSNMLNVVVATLVVSVLAAMIGGELDE